MVGSSRRLGSTCRLSRKMSTKATAKRTARSMIRKVTSMVTKAKPTKLVLQPLVETPSWDGAGSGEVCIGSAVVPSEGEQRAMGALSPPLRPLLMMPCCLPRAADCAVAAAWHGRSRVVSCISCEASGRLTHGLSAKTIFKTLCVAG
eukprot:Rmarinus@m.20556